MSQGLQDGPDPRVPQDQRLLSQGRQDQLDKQGRRVPRVWDRLVPPEQQGLPEPGQLDQLDKARPEQQVRVVVVQLGRRESLEPQVRQVPPDPSDQPDSQERQDLQVQLLVSALLARPDRLLQVLQDRPDLVVQLRLLVQPDLLARQARQELPDP